MLEGIALDGKRALDFGCGLGGTCHYLAQNNAVDMTGIDINPWLIDRAKLEIPPNLKGQVGFTLNTDNTKLPFSDETFDVILSKGVLCHVEDKKPLFAEFYRILKQGGCLVINDWLSRAQGEWGENVQKMVELEGLSIFAETLKRYRELLAQAQFHQIEWIDRSLQYAAYNEAIVENLQKGDSGKEFLKQFGSKLHIEAIEGYGAIAKAMRTGEGLVIQIRGLK